MEPTAAWGVTAPVVQPRRGTMERTRHIVAGVAAVVALVAAVAVVLGRSSVPGGAAALLSSNTWAWGDQPMSMDPMAAATQVLVFLSCVVYVCYLCVACMSV